MPADIKIPASSIKIAAVLKALGHPVRIEILRLLASVNRKRCVHEIHSALQITQPETSRHLILLKRHSIISCERKNGYSFYTLNRQFPFMNPILSSLSAHENKK
jgi:ArsR family transcriptional regulator, arsenate/arsenite/antimonite-responsive transcriptional repressor